MHLGHDRSDEGQRATIRAVPVPVLHCLGIRLESGKNCFFWHSNIHQVFTAYSQFCAQLDGMVSALLASRVSPATNCGKRTMLSNVGGALSVLGIFLMSVVSRNFDDSGLWQGKKVKG